MQLQRQLHPGEEAARTLNVKGRTGLLAWRDQ